MREILRRLKLISDAIKTDNEESVKLEIDGLKTLDLDDEVRHIVEHLEDGDRNLLAINIYLKKQHYCIAEVDDATKALKSELTLLEKEFQELSHEKGRCLNTIDDFNTQYSLKLGTLIRKVLSLKRGIPYRGVADKEKRLKSAKELYLEEKKDLEKLKSDISSLEFELDSIDEFEDRYDDIYSKLQSLRTEFQNREELLNEKRRSVKKIKEDMDYDPKYQEYKESQIEYEEFKNEYKDILSEKKHTLTPDEKIEIKKLFKKAAKLCHPDIVAKEMREKAQQIIQELNVAYSTRDLSKVKEILSQLENTESLDIVANDSNDKEVLKFKIVDMKAKIRDIKVEIEEIQHDETYNTIEGLEDWSVYFSEMRDGLQKEYDRLKKELFEYI